MGVVGFFAKVSGMPFMWGSHYVAGLELEILPPQHLEISDYQHTRHHSILQTATILKAKKYAPLKAKYISLTLGFIYCLLNTSTQVSN